ncbi:MAG TPA: ABC transporter ATP-binding protein [Actinomycetota bacterium]|nr:ABC transporter ATP-binding protein [Actinomycetota bacterium]
MYELRKVTKTFRKDRGTVTALRDVDLEIDEGDFLVIQGPTGQGKSTLLQLLGALDRPTSGEVRFEGNDLGVMRESQLTGLRARSFGFVFQGFNLISTLSAQENVETALAPLRVSTPERRERAIHALADVGLAERARHLPSELSGGEQQRVAIARALVREPRVILADEPTGNLDERTRDEIFELLEGLWARRGQTVVVVTHDSKLARRSPRTAWIHDGALTMFEGRNRSPANASDGTAPQIPPAPTREEVAIMPDE